MTIKSILVHVEPAPGGERRLKVAIQLAERYGARLIGLGAEASITPVMLAGRRVVDLAVMESVQKHLSEHRVGARRHFEALAGSGARSCWMSGEDFPDRQLSLHARAADLIVADRSGRRQDPAQVAKIADVVMSAGAPVLLAPDGDAAFAGEHVIIAWKDTRESRRAVGDALPFLTRAKTVTVVGVGGAEIERAGLAEVAGRLSMHGVAATTEVLEPRPNASVSATLQDSAIWHSADLIVAGAYGSSRVREWLLGGVTQDLIAASSKFVLLSH